VFFSNLLEEAAEQQKPITKTRKKEKHERRGGCLVIYAPLAHLSLPYEDDIPGSQKRTTFKRRVIWN
jgi:hypothetical protein